MICSDIIHKLQDLAPEEIACSWDNVGLLVGRSDKNVSTILVSLEIDDETVDMAVEGQVDMIITHHPMIFHPLKTVNSESPSGRFLMRLLRSDISVYAMHTNYDMAADGMGEMAAKKIGLLESRVLEDPIRYKDRHQNEKIGGLGRIGSLPKPMTARKLCEHLDQVFDHEGIRIYSPYGHDDELLSQCAVVPGSGGDMVDLALTSGADVLLTADVSHHTAQDAMAQGLTILDMGHYCMEYPFTEALENWLSENISAEVEIRTVPFHAPFSTYTGRK